MALCKRNKVWWIRFSHNGDRIQQSTGTTNKVAAQELHDRFKADLWRQNKLGEKPDLFWQEAVVKWLDVCKRKSKRSLEELRFQLKWVEPHLKNKKLIEIDTYLIDEIIKARKAEKVSNTTINRVLEIIRAVLNYALRKGFVDKLPLIELYDEVERDRWLTKEEAEKLLKELPPHLADMTAFTLLTGLRKANVTGLRWRNVDLVKRHAFVPASQSKTNKAIPVPLSAKAVEIIRRQMGKHIEFVFTYQGKPVKQCNTKAWRNALKKTGIEDFRWHDLRHTWASWHVQNGTSLYELQKLGGWSSYETVGRYSHLNSQQLQEAAERVSGTKLVHSNI